jgi:hypothetical protein
MSRDEAEFGYRYDDSTSVIGPFRSKDTAVRRVREDLSRVLMQRPVGSTTPEAWREVRES